MTIPEPYCVMFRPRSTPPSAPPPSPKYRLVSRVQGSTQLPHSPKCPPSRPKPLSLPNRRQRHRFLHMDPPRTPRIQTLPDGLCLPVLCRCQPGLPGETFGEASTAPPTSSVSLSLAQGGQLSKQSIGAIAASVSIVCLLLVISGLWLCWRRRRSRAPMMNIVQPYDVASAPAHSGASGKASIELLPPPYPISQRPRPVSGKSALAPKLPLYGYTAHEPQVLEGSDVGWGDDEHGGLGVEKSPGNLSINNPRPDPVRLAPLSQYGRTSRVCNDDARSVVRFHSARSA
ncbi:hypothetical protein C8Q76DRAFT_113709 [Earliella scabrosa]|nr:hypothetical protein C8Q76DRAFT_113709 [Earliella scabrosa]